MDKKREAFESWWEEFCSAHEDWRFADSDALRWATWQAAQTAQLSQAGEPVAYQSRMRPLWGQRLWNEWSNCTKGMHDDYKKTPILNDWQFEARALSVTPHGAQQPSQAGELSDVTILKIATQSRVPRVVINEVVIRFARNLFAAINAKESGK